MIRLVQMMFQPGKKKSAKKIFQKRKPNKLGSGRVRVDGVGSGRMGSDGTGSGRAR